MFLSKHKHLSGRTSGLSCLSKASVLLSLPFFMMGLSQATSAESASTLKPLPTFEVAAAQTRYNFNRARYRSEPYYFRKKKKRRTTRSRRSLKKQLAAIKTWEVDENNKDPIQLIVSTKQQKISVFKGSQLVVTSRVSSGKKGNATPTGVFSILGKKRYHHSNIYSRAPMPYMQRLTWSGIALHASNSVPNYPASHGCVRLPNSFAPKLFKFTERGAHVIIADEAPRVVELNGLDILKPLSAEMREAELGKIKAELSAKQMKAHQEKLEKEALKAAKVAKKSPAKQTKPDEVAAEKEQVMEVPQVEVKLSQAPIRILITRRLGRERVRDVQDMLRELGHDPGESDGYMGKDTGKAIIAFQKSQALQATGSFSEELETALYKIVRKKEAPTGYLYVRQDFKNLLSTPITIKEHHRPLGTHLITAQHFTPEDSSVRWRAMTLNDTAPDFLVQDEEPQQQNESQTELKAMPEKVQVAQAGNAVTVPAPAKAQQAETPAEAPSSPVIDPKKAAEIDKKKMEVKLDAEHREKIRQTLARVQIPEDVATRLSLLLTPGSSIAISDKGLSKETTPFGTDFILLTR